MNCFVEIVTGVLSVNISANRKKLGKIVNLEVIKKKPLSTTQDVESVDNN